MLNRSLRDDEQDAIEVGFVAGVDRGHEVADVGRVEGPPEHADALSAASAHRREHTVPGTTDVRVVPGPGRGPVVP